MTGRRWAVLVAAGLLLAAAPLGAHHSLTSEFDLTQPVTLTGRVTRIEWVNPHAYLYIDVAAAHGGVTNWGLQMGSPNGLVRRDGRSVVLPSGRRLFTGPVDGQTS